MAGVNREVRQAKRYGKTSKRLGRWRTGGGPATRSEHWSRGAVVKGGTAYLSEGGGGGLYSSCV